LVSTTMDKIHVASRSKLACGMCGTWFETAAAATAHSRLHFSFSRGDPGRGFVPLASLTAAEMVQYDCQLHADGSYMPTVGQQEAVISKQFDDRRRSGRDRVGGIAQADNA
jgi:hypothetical protein